MRHDKNILIQPPNLKRNAFPAKLFFLKMPTLPYISTIFYQHAATRSHLQPLAATRLAASGRRSKRLHEASEASAWQPLAATSNHSRGRKWPLQTVPSKWTQVAAPEFPASGRKWPPQPVPGKWPQVTASGRFRPNQFPASKQSLWKNVPIRSK